MSVKKIHILGICGTFMGSLALLARELGFEVSGCDENIYPSNSKRKNHFGFILWNGGFGAQIWGVS